jgi:hypothetical protein
MENNSPVTNWGSAGSAANCYEALRGAIGKLIHELQRERLYVVGGPMKSLGAGHSRAQWKLTMTC